MKITLDAKELNQAVLDYLTAQGLSIDTDKASVEITSEGVKIDTNPSNTDAPTHKTKTEKKTESKPTAKPVSQKETETDSDTPAVQDEPIQEDSVDDEVQGSQDGQDTKTLFNEDKPNAFAFKQSTTNDVRKLFA